MIRQIVLEPAEAGQPETVGVLLTSADLNDNQIRSLGERLVRAGQAVRGHVGTVRYRFAMLDYPVPGLEYVTVRIPDGEVLYAWKGGSLGQSEVLGDHLPVDWNRCLSRHEVDNAVAASRRPCDRAPRWLWLLVAIVGLGIIIAGVR